MISRAKAVKATNILQANFIPEMKRDKYARINTIALGIKIVAKQKYCIFLKVILKSMPLDPSYKNISKSKICPCKRPRIKSFVGFRVDQSNGNKFNHINIFIKLLKQIIEINIRSMSLQVPCYLFYNRLKHLKKSSLFRPHLLKSLQNFLKHLSKQISVGKDRQIFKLIILCKWL